VDAEVIQLVTQTGSDQRLTRPPSFGVAGFKNDSIVVDGTPMQTERLGGAAAAEAHHSPESTVLGSGRRIEKLIQLLGR
jgi:hypothetical protein